MAVIVAKTGRTWKFVFCRDMSLALGVLEYILALASGTYLLNVVPYIVILAK
jgi:hypothetical protein